MELVKRSRVTSIDLLKGIVMVIMALDHVRDYFHYDVFFYSPDDLSQTSIAIFFTRFVTHFCAPVFMFLAGTSAFFVGQRKSKSELSVWLLKRGLWLIFLEFTIVKFGWMFKLDYTNIGFLVIWALGVSMIALAAFIHVPKKAMIFLCLLVVFGHNALDGFMPESWSGLWKFMHVRSSIEIKGVVLRPLYPLIPWIFVMPLGYYFGLFYRKDFNSELRKKWLRYIGITAIVLFVIIRFLNVYGDLNPWVQQDSLAFTVLSFFNLAKYPPSLLFLLITLGPSILFLSLVENWKGKLNNALVTIGRVPMFFYIIHIYVIHLLAMLAAVVYGLPASVMITDVFVVMVPELQGYGYPLWGVYLVWLLIVLGLYPLCKLFWNYKKNNRDKWWLSYI